MPIKRARRRVVVPSFGAALKTARGTLSLAQVTIKTGISSSALRELEAGSVIAPDPVALEKLAHLYGVSLLSLVRLLRWNREHLTATEPPPAEESSDADMRVVGDEESLVRVYRTLSRPARLAVLNYVAFQVHEEMTARQNENILHTSAQRYEVQVETDHVTRLEGPKCPDCGCLATTHPPGACLDRWVHTAFLGQSITDKSPPYSVTPPHPSLEALIGAPLWPETFAVMLTSQGCTVGRKVGEAPDFENYEIVAAADNLPLAVCRAAVSASPSGNRRLHIK
jgi:transcriptional regulator with XRE-family HTH domain